MAITIREYGTPDAGNLVAAYDASCGSSVTEFHSSLNALSKHKPAPRALSGASLSDEEWKDALNKVPDRRELSIDKVTAACQLIDKLKAGQDLNAPEAIMVDDVFGFLKSFVNPNRPHEHPEIETSEPAPGGYKPAWASMMTRIVIAPVGTGSPDSIRISDATMTLNEVR